MSIFLYSRILSIFVNANVIVNIYIIVIIIIIMEQPQQVALKGTIQLGSQEKRKDRKNMQM